LFRPLPYPDSDQLVVLLEVNTRNGKLAGSVPAGLVEPVASSCGTLDGIAAFGFGGDEPLVRGPAGATLARSLAVSPETFRVLGVAPVGHGTKDSRQLSGQSAIVTRRLAEQIIGGVDRAIGTTILADGAAYSVAAVMPAGFVFPPYVIGRTPDVYTFFQPTGSTERSRVLAIARVRRGVPLEVARAEVLAVSQREFAARFGNRSSGIETRLLREVVNGRARPPASLILAGALLFALISWVNAGQLLVARVWEQRRDLAIRAAIGASAVTPVVYRDLDAAAGMTRFIVARPRGDARRLEPLIDRAVSELSRFVSTRCLRP